MKTPIAQIRKYYGLTLGDQVRQICQPLYALGFSYFHFFKVLGNRSCVSLCTHPELVVFRYENYGYGHLQFDPTLSKQNIIWGLPPYNELPAVKTLREIYNLDYGITMLNKLVDGDEFAHFATARGHHAILNIYLNHIDLLEKFIIYFKEKAHKLITQCSKHAIIVPNPGNIYMTDALPLSDLGKFEQDIAVRKIRLGNVSINHTEVSIVKNIAIGKTCRQIAQEMSLSSRTIEQYLVNIKTKLNCKKSTELIAMFYKTKLIT